MEAQAKANKHKKIQRLTLMIGGFTALIMIIVIIIVAAKNSQITKRENMNIDQYIAYISSHKFSKDISGEDTFRSIDVKDNYINVFLNNDSASSRTYLYDVISIMNELTNDAEFLNVNCDGISYNYAVDVVDKYGNVSQPVCCIITINKKDFKKIKWDTVTMKGLSQVAEKFWFDKNIVTVD